MHYKVITPGPGYRAESLEHAKAIAHSGLERIAAKRGYSMTEHTSSQGSVIFRVFNSKGKQVTGAKIVQVAGEDVDPLTMQRILWAAEDQSNAEVAEQFGVTVDTVIDVLLAFSRTP